ncbi:response regulator [Brevundimonas pondensis]|uniref:response regulator transcription factor n=1 Tax=Brevundimonas pondensis TaxID=2774189 RepID=UPI0028D2C8AB|nr:response regulator [uncultured Brevundimonas sp.]
MTTGRAVRLEASEQGGRQTAPLPQEIIVIDDDRALLELTLLTVRAGGYRAVGFHDPLDALMWASDAEPTCIVSDLKIPGVEGLDLVAAFCALNRHAVIIVSAFVDVRMTVDAMRLGVDDVLPKPASDESLIRAIKRGAAALPAVPVREDVAFTRRERQVAELMLAGNTTKQIAQTLALSPRTVEFFRASLLRKTQSPNSAALASALTRIGFGKN